MNKLPSARPVVEVFETAIRHDMVTKVLDHGFVKLIDYMGDEMSVVDAARVSTGRVGKTPEEDVALIRFLYCSGHTSPFEQVVSKWHHKMPIFVAREGVRHRTARLNEMSGRYRQLPNEFYVPSIERICKQSSSNKQGSGDPFDSADAEVIRQRKIDYQQLAYSEYEYQLGLGVAREIARTELPLSIYTEWIWQMDLHNMCNFLSLRMDSNAQWEIRQYANAMYDILKPAYPIVIAAFDNYDLRRGAISFSAAEQKVFQCLNDWGGVQDNPKNLLLDSAKDHPAIGHLLSKREWAGFKEKLEALGFK